MTREQSCDLNYDGCKRLGLAILEQAFRDNGSLYIELRRDAFTFLRSPWAKHLSELCDFELNQDCAFLIARGEAAIKKRLSAMKKNHKKKREGE